MLGQWTERAAKISVSWVFCFQLFNNPWICSHRRDHGSTSTSSGVSTPFNKSGAQTPRVEDDVITAPSLNVDLQIAGNVEQLSEKLSRRTSYSKPTIAKTPPVRVSSGGPSQEHIEQGKVKKDVYLQYIKAASKIGFSTFLLVTILQQVASVVANLVLRSWGEHNQDVGDNSGMFKYLLGYGLSSLSAILLGGAAAILLWVFCSVRSARHLHDSVSVFGAFYLFQDSHMPNRRCWTPLWELPSVSLNWHQPDGK